jgi:hypothetical protein
VNTKSRRKLVFLNQILYKLKFREITEAQPKLHSQEYNMRHDAARITETCKANILSGINHFLNRETTQQDTFNSRKYNRRSAHAQENYKPLFPWFTSASQVQTSQCFDHWLFMQVQFDDFSLDIDSSLITQNSSG